MIGRQIIKEQWWLMCCSFPNRNWARLRIYEDGSADVFDMDGRLLNFISEKEASFHLREDEYTMLDNLDEEDECELGCSKELINPPAGKNDDELLPQMYTRATSEEGL